MTLLHKRYYKAVNMHGRDFFSNSVQWIPEKTWPFQRHVVRHPSMNFIHSFSEAEDYLSVTDDPTYIPGAGWPLRLIEVSSKTAVRPPNRHDAEKYPHKIVHTKFRFRKELDPFLVFGTKAEVVRELIGAIDAVPPKARERFRAVVDNDPDLLEELRNDFERCRWLRETLRTPSSERRLLAEAIASSLNMGTDKSKYYHVANAYSGQVIAAGIYDPDFANTSLYEEISADFLTYLDVTLPPLPQGV